MADLQKKMKFWKAKGQEFGDLWAVRINSGKFGVPWDRTKRILEQCGMDVKVVAPGADVVEVGGEGKQDGRETSILDKTAIVEGQASLLNATNEGPVTEENSKDPAKISKKGKKRKESSTPHEPQPSDNVSEDQVKSSKRRKEKKHDSEKHESPSRKKAKGKTLQSSLEPR